MVPTLPAPLNPDPQNSPDSPRGPHSPRGPLAGIAELAEPIRALGESPDSVTQLGAGGPTGPRFHTVGRGELLVGRRFESLHSELGHDSAFFLAVEGEASDKDLAAWRNALWPLVHVGAVLRTQGGTGILTTMGGSEKLPQSFDFDGAVLFGRRKDHVMSPDATVEKFDRNAKGWDGDPSGSGYPHFRWMRRFVGTYAKPHARPEGRPLRVLDFGCGAGWVGIEAAKAFGNVELGSFDPSPEMVKITGANAAKQGIDRFDGRVGFGEAPPFGGDKSDRFDFVLSSGVVSFSPDVETWMDGLMSTLAPGADLVIGDIHPHSGGFRRRRQRKPLLPVREMNARSREEIRLGLEARGMRHVQSGAYQLTRPIPEAMHVNETKLKGVLTYPLLWANKLATAIDGSFGSPMQDRFDSWVMHLRAPE